MTRRQELALGLSLVLVLVGGVWVAASSTLVGMIPGGLIFAAGAAILVYLGETTKPPRGGAR